MIRLSYFICSYNLFNFPANRKIAWWKSKALGPNNYSFHLHSMGLDKGLKLCRQTCSLGSDSQNGIYASARTRPSPICTAPGLLLMSNDVTLKEDRVGTLFPHNLKPICIHSPTKCRGAEIMWFLQAVLHA